jgi:hypothetical protein
MQINSVSVGDVVTLAWNGEAVQVIDQWHMSTKVRSLLNGNGEREICTAVEVLPYEGKGLGGLCACGCGKVVNGIRKSRIYATSACKVRVSKRKGRGNRNSPPLKGAGNPNLAIERA